MTENSVENSLGYKLGGCVSQLFLMLLGLALAFGMLEGVLRLAPERFFSASHGQRSVWFHPTQSHKYGRNAEFTWTQYPLDPVTVTTNSDGWRDDEYDRRASDDTTRIAVIGDSFSASVMLPREQIYADLLEVSLNERLSQPVEVLNAGVEGYNLRAEILAYRNEVAQYSPDIVIWQIFLGNDLEVYPVEDTFARKNSLKNRALRSYGVFLIRCFYDQLCGSAAQAQPLENTLMTARDQTVVDYYGVAPPDEAWSADALFAVQAAALDPQFALDNADAFRSTAAIIDAFAQELDAQGIPLLVVFAPTQMQVDATLRDIYIGDAVNQLELNLPENEIQAMLVTPPPMLTLADAFADACTSELCGYLPYDSHWSAVGNAIVSSEIETALCETPVFALRCN